VAAARLGGACLAFAIVMSAPAPELVLALLAIAFLVVGGSVAALKGPAALVWSGPVVAVILARVFAGTAAALLAALLIALGAWLRIGLIEATAGLAVFGVGVALLGGATVSLIFSFWLLGAGLLVAGRAGTAARARLARAFLTPERTDGRSLP